MSPEPDCCINIYSIRPRFQRFNNLMQQNLQMGVLHRQSITKRKSVKLFFSVIVSPSNIIACQFVFKGFSIYLSGVKRTVPLISVPQFDLLDLAGKYDIRIEGGVLPQGSGYKNPALFIHFYFDCGCNNPSEVITYRL